MNYYTMDYNAVIWKFDLTGHLVDFDVHFHTLIHLKKAQLC